MREEVLSDFWSRAKAIMGEPTEAAKAASAAVAEVTAEVTADAAAEAADKDEVEEEDEVKKEDVGPVSAHYSDYSSGDVEVEPPRECFLCKGQSGRKPQFFGDGDSVFCDICAFLMKLVDEVQGGLTNRQRFIMLNGLSFMCDAIDADSHIYLPNLSTCLEQKVIFKSRSIAG